MSRVSVGAGSPTDFRTDGPDTSASVSAGAGHEASAYTDRFNDVVGNVWHLRGGATAATSGADQRARAEAAVEDGWSQCPDGNCGSTVPLGGTPMSSRIIFDGVLDPLIASLIEHPEIVATDSSSLDVFFQYVFPAGTFTFEACYEAGNAFERAESGCGTPLRAEFAAADGRQVDLTSKLVLGINALGQHTVAFDEARGWSLFNGKWNDSVTMITDIRSNDSEDAHLLNFFNTFRIEQTSNDPSLQFFSALGRTSAAPGSTETPVPVPEPATVSLVLAGLLGAAARRRR